MLANDIRNPDVGATAKSGLWIIGLLIGVDLIITGWTLVMLALAARSFFLGNGVK